MLHRVENCWVLIKTDNYSIIPEDRVLAAIMPVCRQAGSPTSLDTLT